MLEIIEHNDLGYPPRTIHNAKTADITIAFAVDFTSAGERLTHKAAGTKYLPIPITNDIVSGARNIFRAVKAHQAKKVNIAGNSLPTLASHGWTQSMINRYVYEHLKLVTDHLEIQQIISGGQTGVDIAGIVAASVLGIPAVATLPKGFIQRLENGIDVSRTADEILQEIYQWQNDLQRTLKANNVNLVISG